MGKRASSLVQMFVLLVVKKDGKFLLIQEAKPEEGNPWYFPAGGVEPGEDLITAAKREAKEEAGVEILPKYLMEVEHNLPRRQKGDEPQIERWRFFLVGEFCGGTLKTKADQESLQAKWFTVEELSSLHLRTPKVIEMVEKYEKTPPLFPLDQYSLRFF